MSAHERREAADGARVDLDDALPTAGADSQAEVAAYVVVAHGLLTSASVVVGLTDTLLDRWDEIPDDRRRDLVAKSREQARTIQSVLHAMVTTLPPELVEPIREAIAAQLDAQDVDAATDDRRAAGTDASPSTSSRSSGARPQSQR